MSVTIVKEVLAEQVKQGMKDNELADHYGLPVATIKKARKAAGLRLRSFPKTKKFVLVDSTTEVDESQILEVPFEQEETIPEEQEELVEETKVKTKSAEPTQVEEVELDMEVISTINNSVPPLIDETTEEDNTDTPSGDDDFIF